MSNQTLYGAFTTIFLVIFVTTILAESPLPSGPGVINSQQETPADFIDSSEWIPMRQPCLTCHDEDDQNSAQTTDQEQHPKQAQQKSGRVLNTAVAFQRNFLPRQQQQHLEGPVDKLQYNIPHPPPPPPGAHSQYNPYVQQAHLTPQFLPHLEGANFNAAPIFSPNAQRFLPPQIHQAPRHQPQAQFYVNQPQDDFHLLQQILNSQNGQFANSIFDVPQSIPINQTQTYVNPETPSTPKPTAEPTTTTVEPRKNNEEISLLYVPLETLRQRGPSTRTKPELVTDKSFQGQFEQDFGQQSFQTQTSPKTTLVGIVTTSPRSTPSTTVSAPPKKKNKLKPHQPPLAVFMNADDKEPEVKVTDVLSVLNTARTISVLDQVGPKMPQVFVGPSTLKAPEGYAKFELPYLSSLDHNRIQRKVEQLPFFVAPLSYNVPDGYSKIPFPSPHVGSVVIRDMKELHNKPRPDVITSSDAENIYSNPLLNQFNSNFEIPTFQTPQPNYYETRQPPARQQQQYFSESLTPTRQNQYSDSTFTQDNGALNNYYFTKPTPRPETIEPKRPSYKITTSDPGLSQHLISSTPSSLLDYTILEQFPIRESQSTTTTAGLKSSPYNFDKYRTQAVGIHDEIRSKPVDLSVAHVTQLTQEVTATLQPQSIRQHTNIGSSTTEQSTLEVFPQKIQQQNLFTLEPKPQPQFYHHQRLASSTTEQPTREIFPQKIQQQNSYTLDSKPQFYQEQIPFSPIQQPQKYEQIYQQPETQNQYTSISSSHAPHVQISSQQEHPIKISTDSEPIQQYNLSSLLPPINPQLPGLINSLQDERASSQAPGASVSVSDSLTKSSTQQTTTHETYTRRPVTRGRQRHPSSRPAATTEAPATASPTTRSRGTTPARRRRPQYNGRPKQESENSGEQPNYPTQRVVSTTTTSTTTTTAAPSTETVVITTTRPATRSRYTYQQSIEHTTELPRRNIVTRTRFRTRGRQTTTTTTPEPSTSSTTDSGYQNGHQNNDPLTERISYAYPSENGEVQFQQPKLESGFRVSQEYNSAENPIYQQNYDQYQTNEPQQNYYQQYQEEQQAQKEPVNSEAYSTDTAQSGQPAYSTGTAQSAQPAYSTGTAQSAQPAYSSTTPNVKYVDISSYNNILSSTPSAQRTSEPEVISKPIDGQSVYVRFNGGHQQSALLQHPTSTERVAVSTRRQNGLASRVRTRGRGGAAYSTTSTESEPIRIPSSTEKVETNPEDQEFYGFFRVPSFQPPAEPQEPVRSSTTRSQYSLNPNYDDSSVRSSTAQPKFTNPSSTEQRLSERPNKYYSETPSKYYSQTEQPSKYYSQTEAPNNYYSQTESSQRYYSQTESPNNYYSQTESPNKYYSQPPVSPNPYFSQTERSSTESADTIYVDSAGRQTSPSSYYNPGNNPGEISETQPQSPQSPVYIAPSSTENVEVFNVETTTEKKPQKQYFISSKTPPNRNVRPTNVSPTQYYPSTTARSNGNQAGRYTVRPPTKRIENEPPKVVKIRGRIRKPGARTTTTTEDSFEEEVELQPQQYEEKPVETFTQQTLGLKTKKRPQYSRGQVNYRQSVGNIGTNGNEDDNDGLEEPNYPKAFLQAQELNTKRPEFKITVAPLDQAESAYSDQIPYQSISRAKVVIKSPEDGVSESQWSTKYTTTSFFRKPSNNDIPVEDKATYFQDINNANETTSPGNVTESPLDNIATTESKSIFEQIFEEMAKFGMGDETTTTIEAITESTEGDDDETVGEIKVRKGKRRGYWKRVRVRPVDGLQVAESQHIAAATNLISDAVKKTFPRPSIEQYVISFEQPLEQLNETAKNITQDFVTVLPETIATNESDIFVDVNNNETIISPNLNENVTVELEKTIESKTELNDVKITTEVPELDTNEDATTENIPTITTVVNLLPDIATENQINETKVISEIINEYTKKIEEETQDKKLDVSDPFVLGTSTSTEISHETEICYRGRCVKSNTTSTSSENDSNRGQLP